VALLVAANQPVAANGPTREPGAHALEAFVHRSALRVATIAVLDVGVVTRLRAVDDAVAAGDQVHAASSEVADPIGFDFAVGAATITGLRAAVFALFTCRQETVATKLEHAAGLSWNRARIPFIDL